MFIFNAKVILLDTLIRSVPHTRIGKYIECIFKFLLEQYLIETKIKKIKIKKNCFCK